MSAPNHSGNEIGCSLILFFIAAFWVLVGYLIEHFAGQHVNPILTGGWDIIKSIFHIS